MGITKTTANKNYRVRQQADRWWVEVEHPPGWRQLSWYYFESEAQEDAWQRKEDEK